MADRPCRVYAPVGPCEQLLPYLVRRLLENGANTSFVHALADRSQSAEELVNDRVDSAPLPPPPDLFAPFRRNARGCDLYDGETLSMLRHGVEAHFPHEIRAVPLIGGQEAGGAERPIRAPATPERLLGRVVEATRVDVAAAVNQAVDAFAGWDGLGGDGRAEVLERAAGLLEDDPGIFLYLALQEAGKTWGDAIGEWREAVDFLRYYAAEARRLFAAAQTLPAVAGESNRLVLRGRGVFACISPWNFPLSIFIGQVAAALAAGNAVVAKPAPQTPLMAFVATRLLHRAGVPVQALHLLPGDAQLGQSLVKHPGIAGVAFTGSHASARAIAATLAQGQGPLVPLIAETGGVNAMIVDSSALPEQVAADVVASAFLSAGQRCSALRVLFVQTDVATPVLDLVIGMVARLRLGDPADPATDLGPLIDAAARRRLEEYEAVLAVRGRLLFKGEAPAKGWFFAPRIYEVDWPDLPEREAFGPILHVLRYGHGELDRVLGWLCHNGHGLTLGVHSRIDSTVERVVAEARVGNIYVNRGMTGAMVGCQPFGGMGLSGTGPKAGGPFTLIRYATEIVVTVNVAAAGGDLSLLCGEGR